MESAFNISSLLKIYFGDERVLSVAKFLDEKKSVSVNGLAGSSASFIIRAVAEKKTGIHFVILQDKEQAAYVLNDLESLNAKTLFFPSSFKKSFNIEEIDTSSIQLRAEVLNTIRQSLQSSTIIISYPEAIAEKVISKEQLEKNSIEIIKGEKISLQFLTDLLNEYGFERCDYVIEPGQFSIRGGIVDVFSFANDAPFRIELSGDEVESIRTFDTVDQLSLQNFERASILPNIQEKLSESNSSSVIDYILESKNDLYVWIDNLPNTIHTIEEGLKTLSEKKELFLGSEEAKKNLEKIPVVEFSSSPLSYGRGAGGEVIFNFSPQPDFNKNFDLLFSNLKNLSADGYNNLILFDNQKQLERLRAIYESIFPAKSNETISFPFQESLGGVHEGFIDNDKKISCYTDHQIFGRYHRYKLKNVGFKKNEALTIKMLKSLQPGDFVTHIDYGIGRFGGLEKIEVNGKQQEAIRLVYKDNDTLHISIHSLHQISKHTGKDGEAPRLDKLGSNAWQNLKRKTKKKVKEIAFDLIKLYAERKAQKG
ncbi:MAG: CarD family transcriptional regulator, partial [Bacteroidia bacterium]